MQRFNTDRPKKSYFALLIFRKGGYVSLFFKKKEKKRKGNRYKWKELRDLAFEVLKTEEREHGVVSAFACLRNSGNLGQREKAN